MKRNSPFPKKFADFRITLGNFLRSIRGDSLPILPGIESVRSENLELSRRNSRILPVFSEIIVYLHKMIMDLKDIN